MVLRARGSLDQVNHDIACHYAQQNSTTALVADLRDHATSRDLPKVTTVQNLAMDIVVHGQDMALPLERELVVPPDAARYALDRAWSMGWPFHARRKLGPYRLAATDTDWVAGEGPTIAGTSVALLLLVTGRALPAPRCSTGPASPSSRHPCTPTDRRRPGARHQPESEVTADSLTLTTSRLTPTQVPPPQT